MRTTTTIPTTLKVLMNHIYELHKGVRHMVLFTCNKDHGVGSRTSELLQMKRQLVLTVVGLQPHRREHILILHSVLSDCALRMDVI